MSFHYAPVCNNIFKKFLFLIIFSLCVVPLFAKPRDAIIHIPLIEGEASEKEYNFFFKQLSYEVANLYYTLEKDRLNSDFFLRSTIMTAAQFSLLQASNEKQIQHAVEIIQKFKDNRYGDEQIFLLDLVNSKTEETIASQYLVYKSVDDPVVAQSVSEMVHNMLANVPKIDIDDSWRNKWLYVGLSGLWTPRIYTAQSREINYTNYGLALLVEYHFWDYMSVSLEPQFVRDWIVVSLTSGEQYTDLMLEIPIILKGVFKPLNYFMIEPYAGVAFNITLMGNTKPSVASWLVGAQIGIKAGPGMIIIDPRYSRDFTSSSLPYNENNIDYNRMAVQIALGYKFGLLDKRKK